MTACSGQDFLELLKKVKYPDVDLLDAASFDWMFEVKELVPFLETLCFDVQDENILSTEEISQYKEFQVNEFDIIKTEKIKCDEVMGNESLIRNEILELKDDIAEAENYVEILEIQRDKLNIHQLELVEESQKIEEQKKSIEKEIMKTQNEILPVAIDKFVNVVDKTARRIGEMDSLLQKTSDHSSNTNRAIFQVSLEPYLDAEASLLDNMNTYLNNSFKKCVIQVNNSFTEDAPEKFPKELKSHQMKLAANALHLREMRQITYEKYLKSSFENTKTETKIKFLDDFIKEHNLNSFVIPFMQIQNKMDESNDNLLKLEKEKERLLNHIPTVVKEHLNARFNWIAVLCSKEKLERYKAYLELLEKPLDILFEQRARLEFLNIAMSIEESNLDKLKHNSQTFVQKLQNEVNDSQNQLNKCVVKSEETSQDTTYVQENSILFTLNNIMDIFGGQIDYQVAYLTTSDVIEKAKKLKLQEEDLLQKSESVYQEQLQLMKTAEANVYLFEKYVKMDNQEFEEHPFLMVDKFSMKVGSLSMKLHLFQEEFLKQMNDFAIKKMMISKNPNIALVRKLYVYALTNPSKFARAIKDIKDKVESYERKKKLMASLSSGKR